jgi:thioredoxin 1
MHINRRIWLAGAVAAATILGGLAAEAADPKPFDPTAFAAAQKAGQPILVEITAPWCPTCKAQKLILSELTSKSKFKDLQIFEINFDTQAALVRSFQARMQSTLIAFNGEREVGRSVGDTGRDSIEILLDKSI